MNYENKNDFATNVTINSTKIESNIVKCKDIKGKHWWTAGNFIDLCGKKYHKLTVIKRLPNDKHEQSVWLCKCDCGTVKPVSGANLRNGHSKSCGCGKKEVTTKRNLKPPYYWIYSMLCRTAKYRKMECNVKYEDILEFVKINKCHYCNEPVEWKQHGISENLHSYQLDRIDNSIGYTKDNCVVCCKVCNRVKSNYFTYREMLKLGNIIKDINESRAYDNS